MRLPSHTIVRPRRLLLATVLLWGNPNGTVHGTVISPVSWVIRVGYNQAARLPAVLLGTAGCPRFMPGTIGQTRLSRSTRHRESLGRDKPSHGRPYQAQPRLLRRRLTEQPDLLHEPLHRTAAWALERSPIAPPPARRIQTNPAEEWGTSPPIRDRRARSIGAQQQILGPCSTRPIPTHIPYRPEGAVEEIRTLHLRQQTLGCNSIRLETVTVIICRVPYSAIKRIRPYTSNPRYVIWFEYNPPSSP